MKTLICVLALLAYAGSAHALFAYSAGAVHGQDPGFGPAEVSVVTFDAPNAPGIVETDLGIPGRVRLWTLTHIDVAATPDGDTTRYEAVQPGGSAKFDFTKYAPGVASLSVYLGSIDKFNAFEITTSLHNYFFDGKAFQIPNGDQFSHRTNRRAYFFFTPNEIFKSITFSSFGVAFEYDSFAAEPYPGLTPTSTPTGSDVWPLVPYRVTNVPKFAANFAAVPEPASWTLMLAGSAAIGGGLRRRRQAVAA